MSYEKVTDHVDIISSQLWKQLLNDLIDRCKAYAYKNPYLNDIANALSILSIPAPGKPVKPSLYNNMVNACRELVRTLGLEPPLDLRTVKTGDYVLARDINALIDCIDMIPPVTPPPPAPTKFIYLIKENDWDTARNYVKPRSFIFVNYDIDTLSSTELNNIVTNQQVLVLNMMDTQPYWGAMPLAFYPIFYITEQPTVGINPPNTGTLTILDPCLEKYLGGIFVAWNDYPVFDTQKVEGVVHWAGFPGETMRHFSYKKYQRGIIIEMPYDAFWCGYSPSPICFDNVMMALSQCFFGTDTPDYILYLAKYDTHSWDYYAEHYGFQIVDLR